MHKVHCWRIGAIESINVHIVKVGIFQFRPAPKYFVGGSRSLEVIVAVIHREYLLCLLLNFVLFWIFYFHFSLFYLMWSLYLFWHRHFCYSLCYVPGALVRLFCRWSCTLMGLLRSVFWVICNGLTHIVGVSIANMCDVTCLFISSCISQVKSCANSILCLRLVLCGFCYALSFLRILGRILFFWFPFMIHVSTCVWQQCRRRPVKLCWFSRDSASGLPFPVTYITCQYSTFLDSWGIEEMWMNGNRSSGWDVQLWNNSNSALNAWERLMVALGGHTASVSRCVSPGVDTLSARWF